MSNIILLSMLLVGVTAPSIHLYRSSNAKSDISRRMDALVGELGAGYEGLAAETKPLVAVFPFETDAELEKHRFGFAAASLLARRLMADRRFVIVRQSELSRIMREQGLGMDRAVDVEIAVKVGKLLGARYVVLGAVARHGKVLQINAKLVETASGQVVSMADHEVPSSQFELAGHRYLAPIPPKRTVGLYYLNNYRHNSNRVPSFTYNPITWLSPQPEYRARVSPVPFSSEFLGVGIRYFPVSSLMVDLSATENETFTAFANYAAEPQTLLGQTVPENRTTYFTNRIYLYRLNMNLAVPIRHGFTGLLGAGASWYELDSRYRSFSPSVIPSIRGGLEYQRRSRWAVSVFVNYDLLKATAKYGVGQGLNGATAFELDKLSIEPSLAFYF